LLLEPAVCPTTKQHHKVKGIFFGEIVQMKWDGTVPEFSCMVIEAVMSRYCGFNSAGRVVRPLTFHELR
jgi:hypothetical protein